MFKFRILAGLVSSVILFKLLVSLKYVPLLVFPYTVRAVQSTSPTRVFGLIPSLKANVSCHTDYNIKG
jgi:hypothetical protein